MVDEGHYAYRYCEKMVNGTDPEYIIGDGDWHIICPACLSKRPHLFDFCYKLSTEEPDSYSSCSDTDTDTDNEEKMTEQEKKHDNHRKQMYGECAVDCEQDLERGCKRVCAGISMPGDSEADTAGPLCEYCFGNSRNYDDRYYWLRPLDKERFTKPPKKKEKK